MRPAPAQRDRLITRFNKRALTVTNVKERYKYHGLALMLAYGASVRTCNEWSRRLRLLHGNVEGEYNVR